MIPKGLTEAGSVVVEGLRELGRGLLDVLYPPRCLGCGSRPGSPELPLCPRCIQSMERAPLTDVRARLDRLSVARDIFDGAMSLWVFDKQSTLQKVQHALKYENRPRYGLVLGKLLGRAYSVEYPDPDGVIPIPLHRLRRLERGYNQSEMLARGVASALECPCRPELLSRPRPTRSQTGLSREERWKNVRDAFSAESECAGGQWLIVDDVLTTGSTAVATAQSLLDRGARSLYLGTLGLARR